MIWNVGQILEYLILCWNFDTQREISISVPFLSKIFPKSCLFCLTGRRPRAVPQCGRPDPLLIPFGLKFQTSVVLVPCEHLLDARLCLGVIRTKSLRVFRPSATVSRIGLMESCTCHVRGGPHPLSPPPPPPLPGMRTWWMVGALRLYADWAYLFRLCCVHLNLTGTFFTKIWQKNAGMRCLSLFVCQWKVNRFLKSWGCVICDCVLYVGDYGSWKSRNLVTGRGRPGLIPEYWGVHV